MIYMSAHISEMPINVLWSPGTLINQPGHLQNIPALWKLFTHSSSSGHHFCVLFVLRKRLGQTKLVFPIYMTPMTSINHNQCQNKKWSVSQKDWEWATLLFTKSRLFISLNAALFTAFLPSPHFVKERETIGTKGVVQAAPSNLVHASIF